MMKRDNSMRDYHIKNDTPVYSNIIITHFLHAKNNFTHFKTLTYSLTSVAGSTST